MVWKADSERGAESRKIRWEIVPWTRGRGLDVGSGPLKPFDHFTSVDVHTFDVVGMRARPDIMADAADMSVIASQSQDFVLCSHLLQEIENWKDVLSECWRVLKPGGHLIVYLPKKGLYPKKPEEWKQEFTEETVIDEMRRYKGWDLIECQERTEGDEFSFLQVYKRNKGDKHSYSWKNPRPTKTACVVRYGAFGDMMQTSSIVAGLKAEGYHVTLQASPPGSDVILHDPNIDVLQIQDPDQVPNAELGPYWAYVEKKYDKFVNLCESVEGSLLAMSDRIHVHWPHIARHKRFNANYAELMRDLAGLAIPYPVRFYPTAEEREGAKKVRAKLGSPVVLWSLAGSAIHKTWPYLDQILARILIKFPQASVVLVGGPDTKMLEAGWENEKRVIKTCGVWNIRQSLAFIEQADLVIGPETGVLNAAAHMDVPKIIFLSHSSVENLTRDWKNTVSLTPANTACYPCHLLHKGWEWCHRDEDAECAECTENEVKYGKRVCSVHTGTAKCQSDISADAMWEHCERILEDKMRRAA